MYLLSLWKLSYFLIKKHVCLGTCSCGIQAVMTILQLWAHPFRREKKIAEYFGFLNKWSISSKGETITRVNGNVSFFACKRLQNF